MLGEIYDVNKYVTYGYDWVVYGSRTTVGGSDVSPAEEVTQDRNI